MAQPKRTLSEYIAGTPQARHHQKAGEKVAMKRNPMSAGWAWNPDDVTRKAIARGNRKLRKAKAEAANMEDAKMATNKAKGKKASKKRTAKKVSKKVAAKSNLIPLKKVCQAAKVDPKMARRTLRASTKWMKVHTSRGRCEFSKAQATQVQKFLTS